MNHQVSIDFSSTKTIALAIALLVFDVVGIVLGIVMSYNRVGGDRAHRIFLAILGVVHFLPSLYYTRIAYYAYKGYTVFSFANILSA
ncbi:hypothetical protein KSP40_PGU006104 [Platanthera guangdongensis]|uniref:Transmembrane protein 230 n=1 Tax=Platanthera guangdongensis TaxID=2320717 RepID=A0ABR2MG16_9ASPA